MTAAIAIRDANPADLDTLRELFVASGLDQPQARGPDRAAWDRVIQMPGVRVLLAEIDERAVGSLTFYVLPMLAHDGGCAAIVESVAVHPQAQGHGIGRALMAAAMRLASEAGCFKLALSSNVARTAAHAFYEHLGFEQHGVSFVVPTQRAAA